jgi:hypothetical protein
MNNKTYKQLECQRRVSFMSLLAVVVVVVHISSVNTLQIQRTAITTPEQQIEALEDFYTSTNGPTWYESYNWLEGDPCTNYWYGVTCDNSSVMYLQYVLTLYILLNFALL